MKLSKLIIPLILAVTLGIGIVSCTGNSDNQ
jgi:hypothetical protein